MDKDQFLDNRRYAGNKSPSMQRRCVGHDYTERGFYMFTLVVQDGRSLFGEVVGDIEASRKSDDAPRIQLTELGQRVKEEWWACGKYHPEIKVIDLQMMPDHLHGILYVTRKMDKPVGMVIRGFKQSCNKHYKRLVLGVEDGIRDGINCGNSLEDSEIDGVALTTQHTEPLYSNESKQAERAGAAFSSVESNQAERSGDVPSSGEIQEPGSVRYAALSTRPNQKPSRKGENRSRGLLFALQYNDRILLRAGQLDAWRNYLRDNPRRLLIKRFHPNYFRVCFGLDIAGYTCSAVGNRFLLSVPDKRQVQCSRSLTEAQIQQQVNTALAAAELGAVHVSPAISPGEKAVMRALLNNGFPLIFLEENGLTSYSKPGGEFFDACARGQLLIIAPWEHHNEQLKITRDKCQELNHIAELICNSD